MGGAVIGPVDQPGLDPGTADRSQPPGLARRDGPIRCAMDEQHRQVLQQGQDADRLGLARILAAPDGDGGEEQLALEQLAAFSLLARWIDQAQVVKV